MLASVTFDRAAYVFSTVAKSVTIRSARIVDEA